MSGLVAAAKKEGTLNVITLPANWANYGAIMKDFTPNGNGIVTSRTFLGQLTRISVRLSGDVVVLVDQQSTDAHAITPGASVEVSLLEAPALVAGRQ